MARRRARTSNSPISFGKTAPVVTDRINRLQVAVSNHKNREKPLFGGEPLVLPRSTKHESTDITKTASSTTAWDTTNYDPNVKWRHLESWQSPQEIGVAAYHAHHHQDENIPIFDPFHLGPTSTAATEAIDRKIDAYLEKAAIYENRKRGKEHTPLLSPPPPTTITPPRRPPLRETSPPLVGLQSPPPPPPPLPVAVRQSLLTHTIKSPVPPSKSPPLVRHERTWNETFSPFATHQSPRKSCLSPEKILGDALSVSFDLSQSQTDLRRVREERKQRRNRAFEKKVYVSKRNRPSGSMNSNDTSTAGQRQSSDNCSISTNSQSTSEDFFEKLVTKASSSSTSSGEDFFDQLVAKSSSSSHGATEWFENLLEDTTATTLEMPSNSNGMKEAQKTHDDTITWGDPFAPPATMAKAPTLPPPRRPEEMRRRKSIAQNNSSTSLTTSQASLQRSLGNNVHPERRTVKSDKSWVQQNPQPDGKVLTKETKGQVSQPATKTGSMPDSLPVPKSVEPKPQAKARSYVLETVESRSGSDSTGSEESDGSISIEHQSFTPKGTDQVTRETSPNWRSKGKSRTDHLLSSIEVEKDTWRKGVYDSFGMRRDPEARSYNHGLDPDGILGNQLTASSSEESRSTDPASSGTENTSVSRSPLRNAVKEYQASASQTKENNAATCHGKSLLDTDVSRSASTSTNSSDDTGPNVDPGHSTKSPLQMKPPRLNKIQRKAIQGRARRRIIDRQKGVNESKAQGPKSDDDSSVFSNLPSVSIAQSNHAQTCRCLPEDGPNQLLLAQGQSLAGDCTTLASGIESEFAILEGVISNTATETAAAKREMNSLVANPRNTSTLHDDGQGPDPCTEISTTKKQTTVESTPCSPSTCDSHDQLRAFWKHLEDVKTLGSFDSDSLVKESGRQTQKQSHQQFIDRYPPTGESDPIMVLSPPQTEEHDRRSLEAPNRDKSSDAFPGDKKKTGIQRRRPSNEMPRQSNARYLTGAPVPHGSFEDSGEPPLHQSAIWMTSIPEQKMQQVENREMPKPVDKSVMYIMGPLMSADTEEEETVLTDDFTRQDDNASVVVQQSCFSCGGLNLTSWRGFLS
eukprot:scaffold4875_cov155-Amphora_coffeaeformis.AAC.6